MGTRVSCGRLKREKRGLTSHYEGFKERIGVGPVGAVKLVRCVTEGEGKRPLAGTQVENWDPMERVILAETISHGSNGGGSRPDVDFCGGRLQPKERPDGSYRHRDRKAKGQEGKGRISL